MVYAPSAKGRNAKGAEIDFSAPAFIEDFGVVEAVRDAYQGKLTLVSTMLQAAQANGLTTAAIGKFGAAFIQDYTRGGIILDEDAAVPLAFARELQQARYPLPRNSINAYEAGALTLAGLMFLLGHGIDRDPLYPWFGGVLEDRTLTPGPKAAALHREALLHLNRFHLISLI